MNDFSNLDIDKVVQFKRKCKGGSYVITCVLNEDQNPPKPEVYFEFQSNALPDDFKSVEMELTYGNVEGLILDLEDVESWLSDIFKEIRQIEQIKNQSQPIIKRRDIRTVRSYDKYEKD